MEARGIVPRAPWGPPGFPLGPPGPPWVPLASKKEKVGSTFNERSVFQVPCFFNTLAKMKKCKSLCNNKRCIKSYNLLNSRFTKKKKDLKNKNQKSKKTKPKKTKFQEK